MVTAGLSNEHAAAEFGSCVRALLRCPMLDRSAGDVFDRVVERHDELRKWFALVCGWRLKIDRRRGYARLSKVPASLTLPRALTRTERTNPSPFDHRRYVLFCVVAAALGGFPRGQVSLQELSHRVVDLTTGDGVLVSYDPEDKEERVAMVDVLSQFTRLGIVVVLDCRDDYERVSDANALYNIDEQRLAGLLIAPRRPRPGMEPAELLREDGCDGEHLDSEATEDDESELSMTHMLMRRLLDDPVVYSADLPAAQRAMLTSSPGRIVRWLSKVGLTLEVRGDGWCVIDPTAESTDIDFPNPTKVVHQASLLLANHLADDEESPQWISMVRTTMEMDTLLAARPQWAKSYRRPGGSRDLATEVRELIVSLGLARSEPDGMTLLPALGRFRNVLVLGEQGEQ